MIMGLPTYTFVHVVISLAGIVSGFVVLFGMVAGQRLPGWTAIFLLTTIATSATGFGFPFERLLPSHVVGVVSLVVLALALFARYGRRLAGPWRWLYAIAAGAALYLNVFVLIVQLFRKVPVLIDLAPTGSEPPFVVTQLAVLVLFVVFTIAAGLGFRREVARA